MALPSLFAVAVSVFFAPRFASYPSFPNGEMASVIPAIHGLKRSNACQGMPACAIADTYLARALSFSFSLSGGPSGSSARDRKRVVTGTRVCGGVELGGRSVREKKRRKN